MKEFPYAELAAKASTPAVRERFAYMTAANRMCPRKAPSVLAGLEGFQSRATKI